MLEVKGLKKTFKMSKKQQKIEKTKEKIKVALSLSAFKEKCPSTSVAVPTLEPFTITLTPMSGSPAPSFTTPFISDTCAIKDSGSPAKNSKIITFRCFIVFQI